MDVGFEGGFSCLSKSINAAMHGDWINSVSGDWVKVAPTGFQTVFANDIRPDAKAAWVSYFSRRNRDVDAMYHLASIVDLVKRARGGERIFPDGIDVVTGGFPCQDFSLSGLRRGFKSHRSRACS